VKPTLKHRVNHLEGLVDLLSNLCTRQDNLATDENEQHNLGLDHAVDETREQLGLVGAEIVMARCQTFETNGELDVARADNVLDLEIGELGIEAEFLDDSRILAGCKLGIIFRLCASDNHLARGKDQSGRLGFTNSHDDSGETLRGLARMSRQME
jgi:hypothetical protein